MSRLLLRAAVPAVASRMVIIASAIGLALSVAGCARKGDIYATDPELREISPARTTGGAAGGTVTLYGSPASLGPHRSETVRPFVRTGLHGDFSNEQSASFSEFRRCISQWEPFGFAFDDNSSLGRHFHSGIQDRSQRTGSHDRDFRRSASHPPKGEPPADGSPGSGWPCHIGIDLLDLNRPCAWRRRDVPRRQYRHSARDRRPECDG